MTEESKEIGVVEDVDLDLDVLVGITKYVKMPGGDIVGIRPPDLDGLFKLSKLGQKMQGAFAGGKEKISEDQAVKIYDELKSNFIALVPQLEPYKDELNYSMVLALLNLVVKISMPSDLEELEKRGIALDDDQKKALQGFLDQ